MPSCFHAGRTVYNTADVPAAPGSSQRGALVLEGMGRCGVRGGGSKVSFPPQREALLCLCYQDTWYCKGLLFCLFSLVVKAGHTLAHTYIQPPSPGLAHPANLFAVSLRYHITELMHMNTNLHGRNSKTATNRFFPPASVQQLH